MKDLLGLTFAVFSIEWCSTDMFSLPQSGVTASWAVYVFIYVAQFSAGQTCQTDSYAVKLLPRWRQNSAVKSLYFCLDAMSLLTDRKANPLLSSNMEVHLSYGSALRRLSV